MKRIIFLAIVIILLVVIVNLAGSLYTLWSKKDLLTETKQELLAEEKENSELKKQMKIVSDPSFVEEQARDKLFMGKPDETLVLFPQASASGMPIKVVEKPVWQQWWELFF